MKKSLFIVTLLSLTIQSIIAQESIHNACKAGDLDSVKKLLNIHPEYLRLKDKNGLTPLHYASTKSLETVAYLIEKGANVNEKSNNGSTPLYTSARFGKTEIARYLLEHNADVNSPSEGGSVLHQAVYRSPHELVELLLSYKIDLSMKDSEGQTALHVACIWNAHEILPLLIEAGADLNMKDRKGNTPLHSCQSFADTKTPGSLKCARILLENGALKEEQNNAKLTPLALSIEKGAKEMETLLRELGVQK